MNVRLKVLVSLLLLLIPAAQAQSGTDTGFAYIGGHVAGAWDRLDYLEPDDPGAEITPRVSGLVGGVLGGYDHRGKATLDDTDDGFGEDHAVHMGWTVGGGLDCMIAGRLGARVEYLYEKYGNESHTISAPVGNRFFPSYDAEVKFTAQTLRGAIVYWF